MREEKTRIKMKDRPEAERPYEKCLSFGPESLTDGELLAVILRTGTRKRSSLDLAWDLLEIDPVYKGLAGLCHVSREKLLELPGIGQVKATMILCLLELSKRISRTGLQSESEYEFNCPEAIAAYYMESMRHRDRERVLLLLLNQRHHLIEDVILSDGGTHSATVPIKEIFVLAMKKNAEYVVLLHNHPSGHPEPSREDIILTNRVKEMGEILQIPLKDHIVIGDRVYYSMLEQGLL